MKQAEVIYGRADLVINLVKNGVRCDEIATRNVIEAIITEERAIQYKYVKPDTEIHDGIGRAKEDK